MSKKKEKEPEVKTSVLNDKKAKIQELVNGINKGRSKDVIHFGLPEIKTIPTGFKYLDQLMGGGLMAGRITTMMGPEASCKTTLAALMMASALKLDPNAIWYWLDFENSLYENRNETKEANKKKVIEKTSWLQTLGVDTERVVFIHSLQTMEDYCNILKEALEEEETLINGIVIDSVGAMMPQGVAYKKVGANLKSKGLESDTMALLPRNLGKFLSVVKGLLAKHRTPMIAITHIYQDINNGGYNVPKGGNAFRHYSDFRLNMNRGPRANWPWNEKVNDKEQYIGFDLSITIDKTKNSQSKQERTQINLPFVFNKGLDEIRFLANRALYDGKIHQAGAYYYLDKDLSDKKPYKDREISVQGTKKFWNLIETDDEIKDNLQEVYKDIDFFRETSDQIKILNEGEDADILEAAIPLAESN